jgi:GNAT superfamily N-acetyltransferase
MSKVASFHRRPIHTTSLILLLPVVLYCYCYCYCYCSCAYTNVRDVHVVEAFTMTMMTSPLPVPLPLPLPILGIGAVLFPVRSTIVTTLSDHSNMNTNMYTKRQELQLVSDFFVDAFWTGKVGGGAKLLTKVQRQQLEQSQTAEFTKRYGSGGSRQQRLSELLVLRKGNQASQSTNKEEILACVGVEVDRIPASGTIRNPITTVTAPLMSNLAVSKRYRQRGLAEQMVRAVEQMVYTQWGYMECYLYVEEQNRAAVRLYTKLGYTKVWRDTQATTLLPTTAGDLQSTSTVILCMKKDLRKSNNLFLRLFQQR